ncbi:MAG: aspartate-alanine antiporter [Muribaculaceae bacterium]|nr:aspartate-alanine antiporter [Muribaculaceae bacterium]
MERTIEFLQQHPLIPVFLTLGLGFWLGKQRFKGFSLGTIAATLIVGIIIGQLEIKVPDMVKNVFFLFFLFATGYGVGPQFIRAIRGPGLKQAAFAIVEALVCAGLVICAAKLMGYDNGVATGLYAGAQTASACLGMVADTIGVMNLSEEQRAYLVMIIPACYAVTYVFGTVGSAWFLSTVAPKMMGGLNKVKEEVGRIEGEMDREDILGPGQIQARRPVSFRAYEAQSDFFDHPRTISEIEARFSNSGWTVFVERLRLKGRITEPAEGVLVSKGDHVVLAGRMEEIVGMQTVFGAEVLDPELLNFGAEKTPVTVSSKRKVAGMTFGELRRQEVMEGVMVASIKRNSLSVPVKAQTEINAGDVITLVGWPRDVARASDYIGYADRQTDATDMVFLGLGLGAGCLLGSLAIKIGGIPMSLGASVGALVMGIILGWLRTRRPTFGRIPSAALWLFQNLGVNMFIAIIGLTAGASFVFGIQKAGWLIFLIGGICTIAGLIINVLIGWKIFRFSMPETLGCVAGGRCSVASLGAINDTLQSDVPNLGFTICYAVANISLVFSSLLVLFLA